MRVPWQRIQRIAGAPPVAALLPVAVVLLGVVSAQQLPYALCGAVGICVLRPNFWRTPPSHVTPSVVVVALLCIWIALSTIWTVERSTAHTRPLLIALFALSGLVLIRTAMLMDARDRAALQWGGVVALILLAALFAFEIATHGMLTGYLRRTPEWYRRAQHLQMPAAMGALLLPLFLPRPRSLPTIVGAVVAWLAALYVAWTVSAGSALLTLIAVAVVYVLARAWPRIVSRVMAALLLLGLLTAPLIPSLLPVGPWLKAIPDDYRVSFYHRIKIWQFTAERIGEKPFFGWGIDASRAIPGANATVNIDKELGFDPPRHNVVGEVLPLHPHNNFLQIWLELGLVGVILVAALLVLMFRFIDRRPGRADRAALLAAVSGAFAVALVSYGLTQTRWVCLIWLLAVFGVGMTQPAAPAKKSGEV